MCIMIETPTLGQLVDAGILKLGIDPCVSLLKLWPDEYVDAFKKPASLSPTNMHTVHRLTHRSRTLHRPHAHGSSPIVDVDCEQSHALPPLVSAEHREISQWTELWHQHTSLLLHRFLIRVQWSTSPMLTSTTVVRCQVARNETAS